MAISTLPPVEFEVDRKVDSYRFLKGLSRRMIKNWVGLEKPRDIPWTPLHKPLDQCTVALISSAGIALAIDQPFDQEVERRNPWFSDPSFRVSCAKKSWMLSSLCLPDRYAAGPWDWFNGVSKPLASAP